MLNVRFKKTSDFITQKTWIRLNTCKYYWKKNRTYARKKQEKEIELKQSYTAVLRRFRCRLRQQQHENTTTADVNNIIALNTLQYVYEHVEEMDNKEMLTQTIQKNT